MNSKVAIVKCEDYEPVLIQQSLRRAVDLIGGISNFIKPGSKVLLKPNLLMAKDPQAGIVTHPEVVRAVIKLLKEINCLIYLGDSPSVWGAQIEDVGRVYEITGIKEVCREESMHLVKFDKRRFRGEFPMTTWLDDCDFVVNLPKFKTHDLTLLTAAIKNLFGLVVGTFKTELHKKYFRNEDFSKMLVDILEIVRPALTIVDGVTAMEGDGPATAGRLRRQKVLLAGSDCVAIDSILSLIMGIKPESVLSTKLAAQRGLGVADIESIDILGDRLEEFKQEPFLLPSTSLTSRIPEPIIKLVKNFIRYYPYVKQKNCTRCEDCIKACPEKVMGMKGGRIAIDYSGCISCFCCQEACPASAIRVKKSILAKLIGL